MSYADGGPTRTAVLRGQRSCADGGPARTAPEGLVPLDSLSPLRRGMGTAIIVPVKCPARQNDSGRGG